MMRKKRKKMSGFGEKFIQIVWIICILNSPYGILLKATPKNSLLSITFRIFKKRMITDNEC